jgi:hypothetical protein
MMAKKVSSLVRIPNRSRWMCMGAIVFLSACTHGRDWDTSDVTIITNPPGAECTFKRNGLKTTARAVTPVKITLARTGTDIRIVCSRSGHASAVTTYSPFFPETGFS